MLVANSSKLLRVACIPMPANHGALVYLHWYTRLKQVSLDEDNALYGFMAASVSLLNLKIYAEPKLVPSMFTSSFRLTIKS